MSIDLIFGMLAHTMGNVDQAATNLGESIALCREAGYLPELARACCDYSELLRDRAVQGDRA